MKIENVFEVWFFQDFRYLWTIGFLTSAARWLEIMVLSVITWQWFEDASYAAWLFAIRMFAVATTGTIFTFLSNVVSGQKVMILSQLLVAISCLTSYFAIEFSPFFGMLCLSLISFFSGALWSVDFSYRRRMLADSLPPSIVISGVSLDVMSSHATRFLGMLAGGTLLAYLENDNVFLVLFFVYTVATILFVKCKDAAKGLDKVESKIQVSSVLKDALAKPKVFVVLMLTPLFNIFALPFVALIPLLFIEKFSTGELLTGSLTALEGVGAVFGALMVSIANPKNMAFVFCTMLFTLFLAIFLSSNSPNVLSLTLFIFGYGVTSSAYSAMQSSIIYASSDPHLRSATFSILTIAIGSGFLGALNVSWMGSFLKVSEVTQIMAIEGLAAFVLIMCYIRFWKRRQA